MLNRNVIENSKVLTENAVVMINLNDLPEEIREDIEECMEENNIPRVDDFMTLKQAFDIYLMWNGISGFTNSLYTILEKSFYAKIELGK